MALKNIAVKGCELTCVPDGVAVITTSESQTVSIDELGVYRGPLSITVSGSSVNGANKNATGTDSLQPGSQCVTFDNLLAVLEGDSVNITATGTTADTPPKTVSGTVTVTITNAGQTSVQGE